MNCRGACEQGRRPCPSKDACAGDPDVWPLLRVVLVVLAPLAVAFALWAVLSA